MPNTNISATLPYWEESDLSIVCGIANAGGGTIIIKSSERKKRRELRQFNKLFETIPALCLHELGLICTTDPVMDGMDLCLEITIPAVEEPISYQGSYFLYSNGENLPIGEDEIARLYDKNATTAWESRLQPFVREDDLDSDISTVLFKNAEKDEEDRDSDRETNELLQKYGLKSAQNNAFTNIGVLLLHRSPELFIPGALVQIALFHSDGTDVGMKEAITGPFTKQLDQTMDSLYNRFLPAALESGTDYDDSTERDSAIIPPREAIKEALLNAMVHKDYESAMPIRISVYPSKLYIDNVGRPPSSWTLSDLMGRHNSRPHNPELALSLQKIGIFNGWGSGISTIVTACTNAGLPSPEFSLRADEMDVCFRFGADYSSEGASIISDGNFDERSKEAHIDASSQTDASNATIMPAPPVLQEGNSSSSAHIEKPIIRPVSSASSNPNSSNRKPTFKERSIAAANRLDMTSTDEYILKVIETNGRITAVKIAEVLGVSESTVRRSFKRLREYSLIERIGSDKAGYWRLMD